MNGLAQSGVDAAAQLRPEPRTPDFRNSHAQRELTALLPPRRSACRGLLDWYTREG